MSTGEIRRVQRLEPGITIDGYPALGVALMTDETFRFVRVLPDGTVDLSTHGEIEWTEVWGPPPPKEK